MKLCPVCETAYPSHHTNCNNDGAMLIESRELDPGTVIRNKYRIVRALGHGGMGTVYLAEHLLLGRLRALKFISGELSRDPRFLKRFRMEAQAAIELRHPNIVEVVDLDQAEDGSPYIAMEYVDGPGLRPALAGGVFPVERALAIARGIALGLGLAHEKSIIHRDVKPENILLAGGNGTPEIPKLLDFGIAAMKQTSTTLSRTRGLMLTPEYASPEQWKGMASDELDGRVDLYALGGVLHEMLTGQTAFHSHTMEGWMYQHLQGEPQPPSLVRLELANWKGLDALVLRMLAKNREDRPANAQELVSELDAVQQHSTQTLIADRTRKSFEPRHSTASPEHPDPIPTLSVSEGAVPASPPGFGSFAAESSVALLGPNLRVIGLAGSILALTICVGLFVFWAFSNWTGHTQHEAASRQSSLAAPTNAPSPLNPSDGVPGAKVSEPRPEAGGLLRISCDISCNWMLDRGASHGAIESPGHKDLTVSEGGHVVEASAPNENGIPPQERHVTIYSSKTSEVNFSFRPVMVNRDQQIAEGLERAQAKHESGDDIGAVAEYNQVLRLDPDNQAARDGKEEVLKECRILAVPCDTK